jgi:dTDP-glucose pyrophosphorylase
MSRAIEILDKGALGIVLVVDDVGLLLGTITDGDIRRGLLTKKEMSTSALEIMSTDPITASIKDGKREILAMMDSNKLLQIPIINSDRLLVGLETMQNIVNTRKHDNYVFLMAGGFGSRLYPLTKGTPKPLLKVGSFPILETIISQFIKSGFHNFFISVHYRADMIKEYFGDGKKLGVNIQYIYESTPLGTAGALGFLPKSIDLPIIMMNGDILTKIDFTNLLNFHNEKKVAATICVREYDLQVPFGVVETNNRFELVGITEKPVHKFFVNAGIYVLNPEFIKKVSGDNYLDMPNFLENQVANGECINTFPLHEYWIDIGRIDEYERANKEINAI